MAYLHLEKGKSAVLEATTKASVVILIISGIPDILFGIWQTLWYLVLGIPICVISYFLNRQGKGVIAGNLFAAGISILIFILGLVSEKDIKVRLYYIPFIIGLPFLINYANRTQLLAHMTHISAFWLILVFYDSSSWIVIPLPENQVHIMGQVNLILTVFFCQFFALMIIFTNRKAENAISISEEKLRDQNEALTKSNQELDKFVYSISHDLRSPVASILGLTTLAQQADSPEEVQEYTQLMERSLLRMESYIQDILDYSRNTRLKVKQELVDFSEELAIVLDKHRAFQETQLIDVQMQIKNPDNVIFYTDRYRLQIILNKVIANAFYYQKSGEPHPKVSIFADISMYHAVIRVIDNGIGIVSEDIDKIFTMFYRSNVTKPGSGLGLYIARESANRIGGRILSLSNEGEGSEFIISLPNLRK